MSFSCPKCGALQENYESCDICGVIFSKIKAKTSGQTENQNEKEKVAVENPLKTKISNSLLMHKSKLSYFYKITAILIASLLLVFLYNYINNNLLTGNLNGEVFVVTNGGTVVRLALADLQIIDKKEYDSYIAKREADIETELVKIKSAIDVIIAKYSDRPNTFGKLLDLAQETRELRERQQYISTSEYLFKDLPHSILQAKTDAEGKLSVNLKRGASVVVIARASRLTFGTTENYLWTVPASLDGKSSKKLSFDNSNLYKHRVRAFWAPF